MLSQFKSQTSLEKLSPSEYSYFLAHGVLDTEAVDPEACWYEKCKPLVIPDTDCDNRTKIKLPYSMNGAIN